ncbi:hypothetical protein AD998_01875 [bacterium 336/3]|nr:hypothetical protein AD998_01875 [bacterium 336/3]
MGWKGNFRTGMAIIRKLEKAEQKRSQAIAKQYKLLQKQEEFNNAQQAVVEYENYLNLITSIHKEANDKVNWEEVINETAPEKPKIANKHEKDAQFKLDNFKPNFLDKLFGSTNKKIEKLKVSVLQAKKEDEKDFDLAMNQYHQDMIDWEKSQNLAKNVLAKDINAYKEAIEYLNPFSELKDVGSGFKVSIEKDYVEVDLMVNGTTVIPDFVLSQLASGKLSKKKITPSRFYELYQDYVCSSVLRIAQEFFSFLPIKFVFVNAVGEVLSTKTGLMEEQAILSVAIPKETLEKINLEKIDPSDSISNFIHNMKFNKTKGFSQVEKINPITFLK